MTAIAAIKTTAATPMRRDGKPPGTLNGTSFSGVSFPLYVTLPFIS